MAPLNSLNGIVNKLIADFAGGVYGEEQGCDVDSDRWLEVLKKVPVNYRQNARIRAAAYREFCYPGPDGREILSCWVSMEDLE